MNSRSPRFHHSNLYSNTCKAYFHYSKGNLMTREPQFYYSSFYS